MKLIFKIILFFIFVVALSLTGLFLVELDKTKKELDPLINYHPDLTTRIYDANGQLISNVFKNHHRLFIPFDKIPARVIETLLATEDTLFFEHHGINFDAIARAMSKNIQAGKFVEGASTITQQLIKTVILSPEKTIERKVNEAMLAIKLEMLLSKEQILERYLNQIYFGHGYYGVRTASLGYFKKEPQELTLKEIAMLIALPRAPSFYDPTKNMQLNLSRANKILYRMHDLGWINKNEFERSVKEIPVVYDESLTQNRSPYVTDEVIRRIKNSLKDFRTGGYNIYTTIDLDYQELAKDALLDGYAKAKERMEKADKNTSKLNGAMVVMDNDSGRIRALVGGVNYQKSNFNRATMSQRQPGSSFKPFVYLSAFNLGYSPYSEIPDISRTYKYYKNGKMHLWKPQNYGKKLHGMVTLEEAVIHSINLATINLTSEIGFARLFGELDKMGFGDIPRDLSVALGSFGISPLEMARNYTVISNYGKRVKPFLIDSIKNDSGTVYDANITAEEICPASQSYLMIDIMESVVARGTGTRARVKTIQMAGKTGTTNDYKDAWFCGFTPSLTTIVWYGNDNYTPMAHGMAGGVVAAPAFKTFFTELLKIHPELKRDFKIPEGVHYMYRDGKRYIYTDISKIPIKREMAPFGESNGQEIIF